MAAAVPKEVMQAAALMEVAVAQQGEAEEEVLKALAVLVAAAVEEAMALQAVLLEALKEEAVTAVQAALTGAVLVAKASRAVREATGCPLHSRKWSITFPSPSSRCADQWAPGRNPFGCGPTSTAHQTVSSSHAPPAHSSHRHRKRRCTRCALRHYLATSSYLGANCRTSQSRRP